MSELAPEVREGLIFLGARGRPLGRQRLTLISARGVERREGALRPTSGVAQEHPATRAPTLEEYTDGDQPRLPRGLGGGAARARGLDVELA
jgi:hypothetical protein